MMRLGIVSAGLFLIALAPFAWAGAPVADAPVDVPMATAAETEETPSQAASSAAVTVFDFGYEDRDTITPVTAVSAGDSVTWVWTSGIHTVTHGLAQDVDGSAAEFDSGIKRATDAEPFFIVDFDSTGVYPYYCTVHPSMRGTVVVA